MSGERLLVNFFYAHPVGHAVEALHYCLGHHAADPTREVAVVLNAATAVELAEFCPFVSRAYASRIRCWNRARTPRRVRPRFPASGIGCLMISAAGRTSSWGPVSRPARLLPGQ